jgi:hypothetical protein
VEMISAASPSGAIGSIGVPFLHITEVRISIPVIAVVGARRAAR